MGYVLKESDSDYFKCAFLAGSRFIYLDRKSQRVVLKDTNWDSIDILFSTNIQHNNLIKTCRIRISRQYPGKNRFYGLINPVTWDEILEPNYTSFYHYGNIVMAELDSEILCVKTLSNKTILADTKSNYIFDNCNLTLPGTCYEIASYMILLLVDLGMIYLLRLSDGVYKSISIPDLIQKYGSSYNIYNIDEEIYKYLLSNPYVFSIITELIKETEQTRGWKEGY